jgi:flavodoxin
MLVLYGSNFGTAEDVAAQIAETATRRGFAARIAALDDHVDALPTEGVVAITTATYNGTPPDNAVEFARWLSEGSPDLTGVRYTVFGCGNQEWAATFQDFPRLVDTRLAELGAVRLYQRGEGDANDDFDGQLERWDTELWPTLGAALSVDVGGSGAAAPRFQVELLPGDRQSPFVASLGARPMRVARTRELTTPDGPVPGERVRHIELELPGDVQYAAGDHLGVVPHNGSALVERVVRRFGLDPGVYIRISAADGAPLVPAARGAHHRRPAARRLRGAAGRGRPPRHRDAAGPHRVPVDPRGAAGAARGPRVPRRGAREAPLGARPARGTPDLQAAVRGVPAAAHATLAALLLHLLLLAHRPADLLDHGRRAGRARALLAAATTGGSARRTCSSRPRTRSSTRSCATPPRRSGCPTTRPGR